MSSDTGKIETTEAVGALLVDHEEFNVTNFNIVMFTVPAGRTWSGTVSVQCAAANDAAAVGTAKVTGLVATAGAGVTPSAGTYIRCDAFAGANAAAGTVGSQSTAEITMPFVVVAPAGNSVTLQCSAQIAGTVGQVNVTAVGQLQ